MEIFKKNKKYKLVVEIDNKTSFYTCDILEEDDVFVKIKDRIGMELTLNKSCIKSSRALL